MSECLYLYACVFRCHGGPKRGGWALNPLELAVVSHLRAKNKTQALLMDESSFQPLILFYLGKEGPFDIEVIR